MKKIITLTLLIGAFATSYAQYNQRQDNDNRNGQYADASNGRYNNRNDGKSYNNGNFISARDRDMQIDKINHDFNFRVQSIQMDRFMRRHQQKVAIRNAEYERARQIEMVNARFNSQFHRDYGRR